MKCVYTVLFFCSCFSTARFLSDRFFELKNLAKTNGIKSHRLSLTTTAVYINNKVYEIFIYDPVERPAQNFYDNTLAAFHGCVDCKFAAWTRDELIKFVRNVPLLHNWQFIHVYNDVIRLILEKSFGFINLISKYIGRFINIQLTLLKIYGHDPFIDTTAAKSLLSLSFEINYLRILYCFDEENCGDDDELDHRVEDEDDENHTKGSDDVVVRDFLEIINGLQRFIYANCAIPSEPVYDDTVKALYGYMTGIPISDDVDIDDFLEDISPMNLESCNSCGVNQMLLINAVTERLGNIKWTTTHGDVSFKKAVDGVQQSNDLEIVFWYQGMLLKTIMKLLFKKTSQYFKKTMAYPQELFDKFNSMYSEIFSDTSGLPEVLTQFFKLMLSNTDNVFSKVMVIDRYTKSLSNIILVEDPNSVSVDFVERVVETYSADEHHDGYAGCALDEFLLQLRLIDGDLKCFLRLFEFLHNDYNRYFTPFNKNTEKMSLFLQQFFVQSPEQIREQKRERDICKYPNNIRCTYVIDLYHFCFEILITLNSMIGVQNNETNNLYFSQAESMLKSIKTHIIFVINHSWNYSLFKTIYNIVPLLETLGEKLLHERRLNGLKRLVNLIMTELNVFGLEYCTPPDYNFLLFNNIDFGKVGKTSTEIRSEINEIMDQMRTDGVKQQYLSVNTFLRVYEDMSPYFASYDQIILIDWKGEQKNIGELYCTSPLHLYTFYGIYFKFSIAALFYELNDIHKKKKISQTNCATFYNVLLETPLFFKFPGRFRKIIDDVNEYSKLLNSVASSEQPPQVEETDEKNIREKIIGQLVQMGISLNLEITKPFIAIPKRVTAAPKVIERTRLDIWMNKTIKKAFSTPVFRSTKIKPPPVIDELSKSIDSINEILTLVGLINKIVSSLEAYEKHGTLENNKP